MNRPRPSAPLRQEYRKEHYAAITAPEPVDGGRHKVHKSRLPPGVASSTSSNQVSLPPLHTQTWTGTRTPPPAIASVWLLDDECAQTGAAENQG